MFLRDVFLPTPGWFLFWHAEWQASLEERLCELPEEWLGCDWNSLL